MSTQLVSPTERFATLIDLDAPPSTVDDGDPKMRPAVALTAALRTASAIAAPAPLSQETRSAMRERLVALAAATPATEPLPGITARITHSLEQGQHRVAGAGRRLSRRISALVGSVVILTSLTGVGVAAARSLPGSPFYDLKRATEAVQLWATSGQAAKGHLHLEFARTRLAEAQRLSPSSPYLSATLSAMNSETRQANSDLVAAYTSTGEIKPLGDLATFTQNQYADLAELGAKLPTSLQSQATYSALLLTGVSHEVQSLTSGLCTNCGTGTPPGPSGSKPATTPTPASTGGTPTRPSAHPTPTPSGLIPTHPLPTLPSLPHHHKNTVLPKLSPLPLFSSLVQLLGG